MNTLHLQDVTYQILVSNFQFLKNNNEKYVNLVFDFRKKYKNFSRKNPNKY